MTFRDVLTTTAALVGALLASRPAAAYEINTHRWMMQEASVLLAARGGAGEYDEAIRYLEDLKYGVEHEDDLADGDANPASIRVMHHFYRPIDDHGLRFPGFADFESSYHWGAVANAQNECDWQDAVREYRSLAPGSVVVAYRCLGQVIHLVQDATVPAHTHLDIHGPQEPEDYEGFCRDRTRSDTDANLSKPPATTQIPVRANLRAHWDAAGRAAYFRNRYPGNLTNTSAPTGRIKEMFPSLVWDASWAQWDITSPALGNYDGDPSADDEWWEEIANVSNVTEQAGWYYFEESKYRPAIDKISFDPQNPANDVYGPATTTMMEAFSRDLVPIAIVESAGMIRRFMDEVVPDVALVTFSAGGASAVTVARGQVVGIELAAMNRGQTAATAQLSVPWREQTSGVTGSLLTTEVVTLPVGGGITRQLMFATAGLAQGTYTIDAELGSVRPGDRTPRDDRKQLTVTISGSLPDAGASDAGVRDDGDGGVIDPGGVEDSSCACRLAVRDDSVSAVVLLGALALGLMLWTRANRQRRRR